MKIELPYFLPVTQVCLRATMIQLVDAIEPERNATETSSWSAELATVADYAEERTVVVSNGLLRDYGIRLDLTDDGRLTSAGVESVGQLGSVLTSAAGLATSIAAAVVFSFPAATPAVPSVISKGGSVRPTGTGTAPGPSPVEARYFQERPGEAAHLVSLRSTHAEVLAQLAAARCRYMDADAAGRAEAWTHYRRTATLLADVSKDLERAKALFDAWRHMHQKFTEYVEAVSVAVSALPMMDRTTGRKLELRWGTDEESAAVRRFFETTGRVLARTTATERPVSAQTVADTRRHASLRMRRPRPVEFASVFQDKDQGLWLTEARRELIVDANCSEVRLPLRKSWFARRKTVVDMSPLGALTSVELDGNATGAAAAAGLSGIEFGALASLFSSLKTARALPEIAPVDEASELARLKREIALTERRLLGAGKAAPQADFARLKQLKQQAASVDAQAHLE